MSQSNGTGRLPQIQAAMPGAYKRALERHKLERAAWQRVVEATRLRKAALVEYEQFCRGQPPPGAPVGLTPVNGLVELEQAEDPEAVLRGAALVADFVAGKQDERLEPEALEGILDDGAAELALVRKIMEDHWAEIPDAAAARVEAFVERERAEAKEKRKAKKEKPPISPPPKELGIDSWCDLRGNPKSEIDNPKSDDGLPPWTTSDLEKELLWAVGPEHPEWQDLIEDGATNPQIANQLEGFWPKSRLYIPASQTGGKLGCTIQFTSGSGYFWLGESKGIGRKAQLHGEYLIARVRAVLEIPTPAEARKRAQESFREVAIRQGIPLTDQTRSGAPRFVKRPPAGWDDAEEHNAAEDLGLPLTSLAICDKCGAARDKVVYPCPSCRSPNYRVSGNPGVWGAPAYKPKTEAMPTDEPVKRGRGRPPGSKTRKAAMS